LSFSVNHNEILPFFIILHWCSGYVGMTESCWSDLELTWENATRLSLQVWFTEWLKGTSYKSELSTEMRLHTAWWNIGIFLKYQAFGSLCWRNGSEPHY